ncbi:hypothetical protein [Mediterraneibacter gnavus]|uniref:hypothetical protein n=1 Tax=Mediterraneibacter gnavus TaxID=33038 RepID=UPI0036D22E8A
MAFDNHAGANKLARTLSERMKNEIKGALCLLILARINSEFTALTTKHFPCKDSEKRLHSL